MGIKNYLVFSLLCLLPAGRQADQCHGVALRCRQELGHVAPLTHCTENGAVFPDECQYREGRCKTGSPLRAKGRACEQPDSDISQPALSEEARSSGKSLKTPLQPWERNKRQRYRFIYTPSYTPSSFERNLFQDMIHQVDGRLNLSIARGVAPAVAMKLYSESHHASGTYSWNPDCWAYGLALSALSVWNNRGGSVFGGTLVSPRHVVWTRHFRLKPGDRMRFVDGSNTVFERTVAAVTDVVSSKGSSFFGEDIAVGVLDQDVPPSVSFVRVLPPDMVFLRPPDHTRVPIFAVDQERKALVADLSFQRHLSVVTRQPSGLRRAYFEMKVPGDSGLPAFAIIDSQLVLLFVNTFAGPGTGSPIAYYYDVINAIMADLGGPYQLTPVDLEAFGDRSLRPSAWESNNYDF